MLDLNRSSSQHSSINHSRSNGAVNDMINLVRFKGEDFAKSPSDFIKKNHCFKSVFTCVFIVVLAGSDDNWVEVIVTKLTGVVALDVWVVSKHGSI